jgi:hypothetical protein
MEEIGMKRELTNFEGGLLAIILSVVGICAVILVITYGHHFLNLIIVEPQRAGINWRYDYYHGYPPPSAKKYCEENLEGELWARANMVNEFNSCKLKGGDILMFKLVDGNAYHLGSEGLLVNKGPYFDEPERKVPIREQWFGKEAPE